MKDSITYFWENGIKKLEEIEDNFFKNPNDIASFVNSVRDEIINLGLLMIKDSFETVNEMLINS